VKKIARVATEVNAASSHHSICMPALNVPVDQLVDAAH